MTSSNSVNPVKIGYISQKGEEQIIIFSTL